VLARLLAQKIQQAVGQNVIIDNRPGAGGALGAGLWRLPRARRLHLVLRQYLDPGGDPGGVEEPRLRSGEAFRPDCQRLRQLHDPGGAPVVPGQDGGGVHRPCQSPPGKLNFGHAGAGNVTHLTGEMFRSLAKIDFLGVPYRGGAESITGLLGQQNDFLFESPVVLLPLIRDGKLRALGVTSAKRVPELPDVPTMVEAGVAGFTATLLTGIVAPAGTPAPVVGKLNGVINETLKAADMTELLTRFGSQARIGSPQDFAAFLAGETRKWADIAKAANVSVD
jgi:tripartite-type tricarboxylate transporter receptor subunit TctC